MGSMTQGFVCTLSARLRADLWLYAAIIGYTAICFALLAATHQWQKASHALYIGQWARAFLMVMPLAVVVFDISTVILRFPRRRRLAYRRLYSIQRLAALIGGLILLWAMMVFQGSFTSIKNILPDLHGGFVHDHLHADIDRWLHLGMDPWRYLYQVAAWPPLLHLIEFNYNVLWFVLCFGGLFFVATSIRVDAIRKRYIIMFMLTWAGLGNVLADLSLSAGPAYYGFVTGDTVRFADQLAFLSSSSSAHSASAYQAYLWKLREMGLAGFGGGISAFPSVHVGLATMNALFLYEYSRRLGVVAYGYVALIILSSVYLGWHYAIDGYVSVIVVVIAHICVRKLGQVRWNLHSFGRVQQAQVTRLMQGESHGMAGKTTVG